MLRCLVVAITALLLQPLMAQSPVLLKEAKKKLVAFLKPLKEKPYTFSKTTEKKQGEYICTRFIALNLRVIGPEPSDYVSKPYKVTIVWQSIPQESKIYPNREQAEKDTEWLAPGKIAGNNTMSVVSEFVATLYFQDDRWIVDQVRVNSSPKSKSSKTLTKNGNLAAWQDYFKFISN